MVAGENARNRVPDISYGPPTCAATARLLNQLLLLPLADSFVLPLVRYEVQQAVQIHHELGEATVYRAYSQPFRPNARPA